MLISLVSKFRWPRETLRRELHVLVNWRGREGEGRFRKDAREKERGEIAPRVIRAIKRASSAMVNNLLTSASVFIPLYNNAAGTVPFDFEQHNRGIAKCRRLLTTMETIGDFFSTTRDSTRTVPHSKKTVVRATTMTRTIDSLFNILSHNVPPNVNIQDAFGIKNEPSLFSGFLGKYLQKNALRYKLKKFLRNWCIIFSYILNIKNKKCIISKTMSELYIK